VLYALLKPGGQWLVYEHVASPKMLARLFQGMLNEHGTADVVIEFMLLIV
jgi:predicted methyltransferase